MVAWLLCCVAASIALVGCLAHAAITLDADFDHASLLSYEVASSGDEHLVNLVGRDNFYSDRWHWLYFRANGVQGINPNFSIADNFAGSPHRIDGHPMVYSYDGQEWMFFDNNQLDGAGRFQFSNNGPFSQDSVLVAYAFPYSYGTSAAHTADVLNSPWAAPTHSGDPNGVIGSSADGVDELGRDISPLPIYAYRITNPATDHPDVAKRKVVVATGMHPGETLGAHTFQGLVDWLISDDPRAAALRDVAEFYAYPTLNPGGQFAGYSRTSVQNPTADPNRFWRPSSWTDHANIRANGEAMLADLAVTAAAVDAFIDFHSALPSTIADDYGQLKFDQQDHLADFWIELKKLQPQLVDIDSTSSSLLRSDSSNFADEFLGAEFDVTFETQFGFERDLQYYRQLGADFGVAFANTWTAPMPEPHSLGMLLVGISVLFLARRRFVGVDF